MGPPPRRPSTTAGALLLAVLALLLNAIPSAAQQIPPSGALPAPELTAQPADQAITLSWTPIAGAARYELWTWWRDDTGWQQLGGDNLTAAAYTHNGLTPGAAYYYQIRAIDAGGQVGLWSQRISVSLPTNLAAPALTASASESAVELSWDAVPGAARYELWTWWRDDTGWQQLGGDNLTAAAYTHAKIAPGVTYYYQARAVNAAGVAGPWSRQLSAVPTQQPPTGAASTPASSPSPAPSATPTQSTAPAPAATPTATPTATPLVPLMTHSLLVTGDAPPVLVAQAASGAIELRWDHVPGASHYELQSWTEAHGWQRLGNESMTGNVFHHTGVTAGAAYYYWVRAINERGGAGPWSERVSAALTAAQAAAPNPTPTASPTPTSTPTLTAGNPGAPTATPTQTSTLPAPAPTATPTRTHSQPASTEFTAPVLTAAASPGAAALRWNAVAGAVRYELQSWTADVGWQQLGGDNLTAASFNHTGLATGVSYYYWVRAVNASGDTTDWSPRVDVTIPSAPSPTTTPSPTAAANAEGNETPTPTLTALPAAATFTATSTATPTATPTAVATASRTPTPPSGPAYGFVHANNLTITKEFPNLTLRWTPAPAAIHYNIYHCLSFSGSASVCRSSLLFNSVYELVGREMTATTFLHQNLPPAPAGQRFSHFYVVQACFRADCPILTRMSPTATPTRLVTPSATPTPTATSAATVFSAPVLTAVAAQGAVELGWLAVPGAVRYQLWYWTSAAGWLQLDDGNLTANRYTHSGLSVGTTYYYSARALNADGGPSAWSANVSATVSAAPQSAPTQTPTQTPTLTPTLTPTPTSTPASAQSASARVQPPPASLNAPPYYRKYLDAGGIPILSSNAVTDEELYQTRDTILAIIADRQDLLNTMSEFGFRVLIYPDRFEHGGLLTDLPEFKGLNLSSRVLGAAGETPSGWVAGAPEVARHCNHTMIHEFAHLIEDALRLRPGGDAFISRLNSTYNVAMLSGLWQERYAATSALEYWAEIVNAWLTPSEFAGSFGPAYQKLEDYDPVAADFVSDILGSPKPLTFCDVQRFDLRGALNMTNGHSSPAETYVLQLSMRAPSGGKRLLGASTAVSRSDATFAFERLVVENVALNSSAGKPHIVIGVYRYNNNGNAACPAAAFLGPGGVLAKTVDSQQWLALEVTGNHITGLNFAIPSNFDWTPLHKCI